MTMMGTTTVIDDDGATIMRDDNVTCIRKMTMEVAESECAIDKRECVMWVIEERVFLCVCISNAVDEGDCSNAIANMAPSSYTIRS